MESVITRIEVQKKNRQRVNIYLDDAFAFGLSILAASSLTTGQSLTAETIDRLVREDEYSRAFTSSIRFLGPRARSTAEMKFYLKGKTFSEECISFTIDRLTRENYLNDSDFARQWVDSRNRFNPKGIWALKQELLQKGVNETVIDETLASQNDEDAAWDAVQKKIDHWKTLDRDAFRKKLYSFLGNRGFSYETTCDIESRINAI